MNSAADLTVTVAGDPGAERLTFTRNSDSKSVTARLADATNRIRAIKRFLPYSLDQLRKAVDLDERVLSPDAKKTAAFRLENLAYDWLDRMLSGSELDAKQLVQRVTKLAEPILLSQGRRSRPPLVELVASEASDIVWLLPLDLLPLSLRSIDPMLRYLGMHFVVVRRRSDGFAAAPPQLAIPVKLFAYRKGDYEGVVSQVEWFSNRKARFKPLAIWPDRAIGVDAAIRGLAAHLRNELVARASKDLGDGDTPRILHFCCHYRLGGVDPQNDVSPVPELGFDDDLNIGIPDLNGRMVKLGRVKNPAGERALLFLNACQSSSQQGLGEGMIEMLLRHGFVNVVGSETLLPDLSAALFALTFYELLLAGHDLGFAVVEGRRALVKSAGNPIGLLYSVYGNPHLRFA